MSSGKAFSVKKSFIFFSLRAKVFQILGENIFSLFSKLNFRSPEKILRKNNASKTICFLNFLRSFTKKILVFCEVFWAGFRRSFLVDRDFFEMKFFFLESFRKSSFWNWAKNSAGLSLASTNSRELLEV